MEDYLAKKMLCFGSTNLSLLRGSGPSETLLTSSQSPKRPPHRPILTENYNMGPEMGISGEQRGKEWKRELARTLAALLWFGVVAYLMSVVQIIGDERMIRSGLTNMTPLPDAGLDLVPHPDWWPKSAADLTLNSYVVISLVACCISAALNGGGPVFVMIYVRRLLWLFGLCYFLRLMTLGGTTLPSSNTKCLFVKRTMLDYLTTGPLVLIGKAQTCTDKLFSGHTALATLLTWFWLATFWTKSPRIQKFVARIYAFIHGSGVFIASMMCRHHYTVDVVLAIIIASLVFHIYHLIIWVKEGYDRGHPYFTVRYGGGPSEVCRKGIAHQMVDTGSDSDSADLPGPSSSIKPRRAPRAARIAFAIVGWLEGLDLRQSSRSY